jgi:N utilization substance protein B
MGARSKARKRALDILFESELRGLPPGATLPERQAAETPPVAEYTVPQGVVLSEAVSLASSLSTDESAAFVNGVLARIAGAAPREAQPH